MKVFIAGVMQGNKKRHVIHPQGYRGRITSLLKKISPNIEIIDPDKTDPNRLKYDDNQAGEMFFRYCFIAGNVDLLISYLPEASMGSAVEMWMAYRAGIPILTISPLSHNWVVRLLSRRIYPNLEAFEQKFDADLLSDLKLS